MSNLKKTLKNAVHRVCGLTAAAAGAAAGVATPLLSGAARYLLCLAAAAPRLTTRGAAARVCVRAIS